MAKRVELVRVEYNVNDPYKRKSVMFNLNNERQREMFVYASTQENFSDYVKTLIERDMAGNVREPVVVDTPSERVERPVERPKVEREESYRQASDKPSGGDFGGMFG